MGEDLKKKRKRKFHGNRYPVVDVTKKSRTDDNDSKIANDCASKRKPNQQPNETVEVNDNYSIIISFEILKSFFDLVVCQDCGEKGKLNDNLEKRMGFSCEIKLACKTCNWSYRRCTPEHVEKENGSSNKGFFQINVQTVLAFREIGKGYRPMCIFTSLMNFPS